MGLPPGGMGIGAERGRRFAPRRVIGLLTGVVVVASCGGDDIAAQAEPGSTSTSDAEGSTAGTTSSSGTSLDVSSSTTGESSTAESSGGGDFTSGGEASDDCDALDTFVDELADLDLRMATDALDRFLGELQYGEHGLPLRCGDRVVFLSREPGSVAGEFNDWAPGTLMLAQPVASVPLWVASVDIEAPGGLYKFVRDGEFVADSEGRRHGWDEFGPYSQIDADPSRSHHERWPEFSLEVGSLAPRPVNVFVPAAVNAGEAVPVLVLQDGQNVFSPDAFFGGWQASNAVDTLISQGTIGPVIVVAIDNTDARFDEYSHVLDDIGQGPVGGDGDEYADFVASGVVPFVRARYPTLRGAHNTAVLGSSMGGLISLHIARRHPDVFGYAGSMSGTLGWGTFGLRNPTMIDLWSEAPPAGVSVYLDSGGDGPCPNGGADNYCETVELAEGLRALGWQDEADLVYRWSAGAQHNEAAWAARLPGALQDWFPGAR